MILLIIVGSVATISVEAFRANFFNIIIETSQKFSLISHKEQNDFNFVGDLPDDWSDYYYPQYIPEEYILITAKELNGTKYMIFSNTTGGEIRFIQGKISAQLQIDSEKGDVIEIDIQGHRGILVEKDNLAILSWTNNDKSFVIHGNVEKSILLLIVESLKKSN